MSGKSLSCMLLLAVLSATCFIGSSISYADSKYKALLTVKAFPAATWQTQLIIRNKKTVKLLMKDWPASAQQALPVSDTYLTLSRGKSEKTYIVDREGYLFRETSKERIDLKKDVRLELLKHVQIARSRHYGDLLQWEKVDRLLPKESVFKVIDLESGLSFTVQRRAGKKHVDAQPLTKRDTATMKRIYGGKWSWRRKAVLVEAGNRRVAASMHGMPHGGDGIPDNDFRGHFCIHFLGSRTHGSRKEDPGHQLMVRKAGGELQNYFDTLPPSRLAEMFFTVINLGEPHAARMLFTQAEHRQPDSFLPEFEKIARIDILSIRAPRLTDELLAVDIPVETRILRKDRGKETNVFIFQFRRMSFVEPWKIDSIMMADGVKNR